jgi:hypothetical protein
MEKIRFSCALSSCNGTNGSLTGYAGGLWRKSGYWNTKTNNPAKFILIRKNINK